MVGGRGRPPPSGIRTQGYTGVRSRGAGNDAAGQCVPPALREFLPHPSFPSRLHRLERGGWSRLREKRQHRMHADAVIKWQRLRL